MRKKSVLKKVAGAFLHRIKFILFATIFVGAVSFAISNYFITPTYKSTALVLVQSGSSGGETANGEEVSGFDSEENSKFAEVCVALFEKSDSMSEIYDEYDVEIKIEDGCFISFSVIDEDARTASETANNISNKCMSIFKTHFAGGRFDTVYSARISESEYEPNNIKSIAMGLVSGFAASLLISVILEFTDKSIRAEDDLSKIYSVPVLAEIPDFEIQT